jgi:hypothetical protein
MQPDSPPEIDIISRWAYEQLQRQADYIRLLEERLAAMEKKIESSS